MIFPWLNTAICQEPKKNLIKPLCHNSGEHVTIVRRSSNSISLSGGVEPLCHKGANIVPTATPVLTEPKTFPFSSASGVDGSSLVVITKKVLKYTNSYMYWFIPNHKGECEEKIYSMGCNTETLPRLTSAHTATSYKITPIRMGYHSTSESYFVLHLVIFPGKQQLCPAATWSTQ